jgi:hypothetical protein
MAPGIQAEYGSHIEREQSIRAIRFSKKG